MANDSTDLFLNINTNLAKNLQVSEKLLGSIDDILIKNQKNFDKISDSYSDIDKNQKSWNKGLKEGNGIIGKIADGAKDIAKTAIGFMALKGVGAIFEEWARSTKELKDTSFRMGEGVRGYKEMEGAVNRVTMATGASIEKSTQLVSELTRFRVASKDIGEMATNAALFSRVTGVSAETTARMAGELNKVGGIGLKGVTALETQMAQMQRTVGMTEADMENLSEATIKNTRVLAAFNKTPAQIEVFNKGVVKLAGSFSKVGLSAQDATELVDKLLDPTQIEDNAMLLAKMGISMQDALTGNIDPATMSKKLASMSKEMLSAGTAGIFQAKAMGISTAQLKQYASMTDDVAAGANNAGKNLKQMQAEQLTPAEKMEQLGNKLTGIFNGILTKLEPLFELIANGLNNGFDNLVKLLPQMISGVTNLLKVFSNPMMLLGLLAAVIFAISFFKKKFFSANTEVNKNLETGVTSAVKMASEKGSILSEKAFKAGNRRWSEDTKQRIAETYFYQNKMEEADHLERMSNTNIYFKSVTSWSSRVAATAAQAAHPASALVRYADQQNKKTVEGIELSRIEGKIRLESFNQSRERAKKELEIVQARLSELGEIEKRGKLGSFQLAEQGKLLKMQNNLNVDENKIKEETGKITARNEAAEMALFNKATKPALDIMLKQNQERRKGIDKIIETANETSKDLELEKLIIEKRQQENALKLEGLSTLKEQGKLDAEGLILYQKMTLENRELAAASTKVVQSIEEQKAAIEKANKLLEEEGKQAEKINLIMGKTKIDSGSLGPYRGIVQKLREGAEAFGSNILSSVNKFAKKVGESAIQFGKSIGESIKNAPKAFAALGGGTGPLATVKGAGVALFTREKEDGSGREANKLGKAMGGLGKMMGGLGLGVGLLSGIFMKNEKVQQVISVVMGILSKIVGTLVDKLLPALLKIMVPLLKVVFTLADALLMPLVKLLLPAALNVLGFLIKAIGFLINVISLGAASSIGNSLIDAGKGMDEAANAVRDLPKDLFTSMSGAIDGLAKMDLSPKTDTSNKVEGDGNNSSANTSASQTESKAAVLKIDNNNGLRVQTPSTTVEEKKKDEAVKETAKSTASSSTNLTAMLKLNEVQKEASETSVQLLTDIKNQLAAQSASFSKLAIAMEKIGFA